MEWMPTCKKSAGARIFLQRRSLSSRWLDEQFEIWRTTIDQLIYCGVDSSFCADR